MKLKKSQRQALKGKYAGRCAYCGVTLREKWHADHIEPVIRNDWLKVPRAPDYPERDTLENMNPACPPCNIDKHSLSLESWRQIIGRSAQVLLRDVSTFRRAVRFDIVRVVEARTVRFYFETLL
jgi:5-methylcytosine-specific restriction endonuclease McrA